MRSWVRRLRRTDVASCAEVAQVLQSYLDGQVDDFTARRVRQHLEQCRRCGLESETYLAIKDALARRSRDVDPHAVDRLRSFGERLTEQKPGEDAGSSA